MSSEQKAKPTWGKEHDEIVSEYKKANEEGKIKGLVIVPRE
ncbi:MAG: hypothetical protein ACRD5H_03035 [Nitrososphaerales archaeon]